MIKDISIIIPVYNEAGVITTCLESLGKQTLKPTEVIIIDDGSTDKSWDVISGIKDIKVIRVIKIQQVHSGPGAARNLGALQAKGKILVFVDADMRFAPDFLADLTELVRQGKSSGTFSTEEFIDNWNNVWARLWNYRRGIYEPRAIPADYPETAPVFRAILKSEFDRAGGFDPSRGYADDWSLSEKLGYPATATCARYYHRNPPTMKEAFSQSRWAAKRKYKFGTWGAIAKLLREFPLWSPIIDSVKLWRRRDQLAESTWVMLGLYPLFLFISNLATMIGISEFLIFKKGYKQ